MNMMLVVMNGNVAKSQQLLKGYCEILNIRRLPDISRTLRLQTLYIICYLADSLTICSTAINSDTIRNMLMDTFISSNQKMSSTTRHVFTTTSWTS